MSIESELIRIQNNIADAYAAVAEKGGQVPLQPTSANLAAAVDSIPSGSTSGPTLEEYDTDDGWHVRKWSDGYVEMTVEVQKNVTAFSTWASGFKFANILEEPKTFPVSLVKKYAETACVMRNDGRWAAWPVAIIAEGVEVLQETSAYGIVLGYGTGGSPPSGTIAIAISVTGRWK